MDIKTLLDNLRKEVSCSVCSDIFTDPKQLPCLHSFCLHCLKQWHRTSHGCDTIRCPKCQAVSRIPESGDLKDLPTSFYLNGLIDVLAIKECTRSHVRCGNCEKKSSETSYCFHCCIFYCQECVTAHNIMRSNKDHRVLALKDFQDKDYENVLKRPVFCAKKRHEKEELKYFCKNCKMAVCQTCVTLSHSGHALEHIEEEAERQKIEMKSMIQLRPAISFGNQGVSVGMFYHPWGVAVNTRDEIAITDHFNHRVQIFKSNGIYLRSFGRYGTKAGEFSYPAGITFHKNGNIFVADSYNYRIQIFSGEGEYVGMFGGQGSLDSQLPYPLGLSVDSDGNIIVADAGNKAIKIFSPDGKFLRMIGGEFTFTYPVHCVQCDRYLVVSDCTEHCIKVFNYNGNFEYKFGKQGGGDGEFDYPWCLSANKSRHLMVCDPNNNRMQVFHLNGKFAGKFGREHCNLGEVISPKSVAVLSTGRIVVSDVFNHRIQLLE